MSGFTDYDPIFDWIHGLTVNVVGSRVGAVVRALTSHQCVPDSIPRPSVICGLSLLLVLFLVPRGFSPVFPSPQKPTFPNSNSIQIIVKHFIMSLWLG